MKLLIILLLITVVMGCGKKVEDPGTPFAFGLDIKASQESLKEGLTIREDENSGPTYSLASPELQNIESIDKKLVCGPLTFSAKRSFKNDNGFLNFKISQAEFPGLNQLPRHPSCILQVTATNSTGSTVTKSIGLSLLFNSSLSLQIPRFVAAKGHYLTTNFVEDKLVLESYEITNPLPYDLSLKFYPVYSVQAWGAFHSAAGQVMCSHSAVSIGIEKIIFDPPSVFINRDVNNNYEFKVKVGQSVKLMALGRTPSSWAGERKTGAGIFSLKDITVVAMNGLEQHSLFQGLDFDIQSNDPQSEETVNIRSVQPHPYTIGYNPAWDPTLNACPHNPEL